jgi:hypothetical protein
MKTIKNILIASFVLALYLASTVPVGLFLYSLKSSYGINVFSETGYHSYTHCLQEQAKKIVSKPE